MTDHAEIVRGALQRAPGMSLAWIADEGEPAMAALDALVAECEDWAVNYDDLQAKTRKQVLRAEAAEARVTELEAALETIWRMHDIPIGGGSYSASMREVARAALAKEDTDD